MNCLSGNGGCVLAASNPPPRFARFVRSHSGVGAEDSRCTTIGPCQPQEGMHCKEASVAKMTERTRRNLLDPACSGSLRRVRWCRGWRRARTTSILCTSVIRSIGCGGTAGIASSARWRRRAKIIIASRPALRVARCPMTCSHVRGSLHPPTIDGRLRRSLCLAGGNSDRGAAQ